MSMVRLPLSRVLVVLALVVPAVPALADDSQFGEGQFYSFVPAPISERRSDAPPWLSDMQQAKTAYRERDYHRARSHLEAALERGNIFAAWYLGHMWRVGLGVQPDQAKAFKYYRQVALGYDPQEPRPGAVDVMVDSLVRVADYYRQGDAEAGIASDPIRAYRLYSAAAGHGHPGAQFGLGIMYLEGIGVRQNPNQALKWLLFAARKRYSPAEAMLGDLYWDGAVVTRDRAQAIKWYLLASQSARRETNPKIFDRLEVMLAEASETEKATGEQSAELWADRFPDPTLRATK